MSRLVLVSLSALLVCSPLLVNAKMYKWTDENGQVHFGDKIPPKYLVKEHDELSDSGIKMKTLSAAKTPEERAEEERLAREKRKAELAEKKKKQRDRVLLDTYTTEADLIAARDARLDAVDTQILLARSIIEESSKKVEALEQNVINIKASDRDVPEDMYKRINSQNHQIKVHKEVMAKHEKRRAEIAKQFEGYIARFKVLKEEQKAKREKMAKERGY